MAVLDDIREQFPYLAFLINDPEVGGLLRQAVDPNTTFSPQRFQAELLNTNWWRRRSEQQRSWDILKHTDPGSANRQRSSMIAGLDLQAGSMGVTLKGNERRFFAEMMLSRGLTPDSPEVLSGLADLYRRGKRGPGAMRTGQSLAARVARHEYMVPISVPEAVKWGSWLGTGRKTENDLRQQMASRAISRYPHLRQELLGGQSMSEIFGGHISTIAEELELSPEQVDLRTGQWLKVIDTYDRNTKTHRPLTLSETRTLARQDNRWWSTANGRAMDSGMTNNILKTFGMRR